jgi:hypothetical protein
MSETITNEEPRQLRPLFFGVGNVPGRLDMTTGHYHDRESWLGSVEWKYGELFTKNLREILPPSCEDDDIRTTVQQAVIDQVIYEFKPLLSQEAIKDHIEWNYEKKGPMMEMFMKDVWEERSADLPLYYTPEAARELVNDLAAETGSTLKMERDGKYRHLFEFNYAFDSEQSNLRRSKKRN